MPPAARRALRGIEGVVPESTGDSTSDLLSALARHLPAGVESARGVWVRQIELENPLP